MRRFIDAIGIGLIYFIFIIVPFACILQIIVKDLHGTSMLAPLTIALLFIFLLLNGIIMTHHYDERFKQITQYITSQDVMAGISPISFNFLLKTRVYRGAVYFGAICFHYLPLKPLFANQRYLSTESDFIESLSLPVKLWAIFMFVFCASCLLAAMVIFVYKYIAPLFWTTLLSN